MNKVPRTDHGGRPGGCVRHPQELRSDRETAEARAEIGDPPCETAPGALGRTPVRDLAEAASGWRSFGLRGTRGRARDGPAPYPVPTRTAPTAHSPR
ncbi:hypothetical protein [Streptomyces sp. NPDC001604]|uniref:hypothetical protein n=1 Tax=Streptomyces sp. NPDC001604 TaxID=3364593 RepID=UPI0036C005CA